jgi:membrane protease YdiL (CAAX protease family)
VTDLSAPSEPSARREAVRLALLVTGFVAALGARVAIGRPDVARSAVAGLVFAVALVALSLSAGAWRSSGTTRAWVGVPGAVVLCVPLLAGRAAGDVGHLPGGSFVPWAGTVAVVALAEELFLRGALYDACVAVRGETLALGAGAVLFALLHVPLYGWRAVPLDLAVGIWLGALRRLSGGWAAAGVAHVVADLAAWWLK